jgi:predicted metal-dependent phosphoesterase TrpH
MKLLPFGKPGRFWRGNLHTHSTSSDGKLTPKEVCERYKKAGYDFLALTDHFLPHYNFPITDTQGFRSKDFTTILGAELHTGKTEHGNLWHILAVGLPLDFARTKEHESGADLAQRALDAGAYVSIAHPQWYALTERDIESLCMVDSIEIFNGTSVNYNDRADSWHIADIMLARGKRYLVCATDDFHAFPDRHDFALGWVQVKSESLDPDALVAALKAGHYYSSTGPEIHDIEVIPGDKILVKCSPAEQIFVTGKAHVAARASGNGITEAEISLKSFNSPYCRITVRDTSGGRAWSNPIWF